MHADVASLSCTPDAASTVDSHAASCPPGASCLFQQRYAVAFQTEQPVLLLGVIPFHMQDFKFNLH